ncbi:MAG TPA: DMT family transporter [Holophagaceae bacterium]|nr:DMT family transporter [Holophagaceae bacterium]
MSERRSHLLAVAAMAVAAAIWGSAFPATKYLQEAGLGVNALLALRFTLASVALLGLTLARGSRWKASDVRDGLVAGVVLASLFWLQTAGLETTTTTKNAFITGLYVIFTPMVALAFGERLKVPHALAVLVACVGLVGLVFKPGESFGGWGPGDTLTLANAVLIGLHIVLIGRFSRRCDTWVLTFTQIAVVAVACGLLALVLPKGGFQASRGLQLRGTWIALLWLGLAGTALTMYLQARFQPWLTATEAGIIFSLEPVVATLLAVSGWIPGVKDNLVPRQWLGGALIVAAALVAELGPRVWGRKA